MDIKEQANLPPRTKSQLFIDKAMLVHGLRYDYSDCVYKNANTKVAIVCSHHGKFWIIPRKHLAGQNCKKCASMHANDKNRITVDGFKRRATTIHFGFYNYSRVSSISNAWSKVDIICPVHGIFKQYVMSHLRGHGCNKCARSARPSPGRSYKYTTEQFVELSNKVHDGTYDYSAVIYKNSHDKIKIICPKHGKFMQAPREHLRGSGCPRCAFDNMSIVNRRSGSDFIALAAAIHNNRYIYNLVDYINQDTDVVIECPYHGEFVQKPRHHLRGQGCPKCSISSGQLSLYNYVSELVPAVINERDIIKPYELDIWVPSRSLAIEYNGLYFHSFGHSESRAERYRHYDKCSLAHSNGVDLLQVSEHEWLYKRGVVKSVILNKLGLSDRLMARKCDIIDVDRTVCKQFYDDYHLQGYRSALVNLALSNDNNIVAMMSFSRHRKFEFEIIRYACIAGCAIAGGPSRLFSAFIRRYNPVSVISYADRRYSSGRMYFNLGFRLDGLTQPGYVYVRGSSVFSRFMFQKHKLAGMLEKFDPGLTEPVNMFNNGYRRLWDAGNLRFIWGKETI